ncbi:unnamed protein product [Phaeothamnion confervicola]
MERYLKGMLANLGRLPAEKIHNLLKMFMSHGEQKYERSMPELVQFLRRLAGQGKLEQTGADYHLPPPAQQPGSRK